MKFCSKCGAKLADDAKFCDYCGAVQEDVMPSGQEPVYPRSDYGQRPAPAPKKNNRKLLLIPLIVLLLAAIVVGTVFFLTRKGPDGSEKGGGGPKKGFDLKDEKLKFDDYEDRLSDLESAPIKLISTDVSDYPTVKLYVSCSEDGETQLTLSSPTARVKETISGGKEIERTIKQVEQIKGNQGIGIDLLTDKSGSMESDLPTMQNVMTEFVDNLDYDAGDKAEVISFDSYVMYMCDFTNDRSRLKNGISNMTAYGETALYDALVTGITNAGSRTGANCVVAFTDGEDNSSTHSYDEALRLALDKEVPVYIIGTGYAEDMLQSLAEQTGGWYWSVDDIYDVGDIYKKIYENQRDMYCIEYESDSKADAYVERLVKCIMLDDTYGCRLEESFTPAKRQEVQKHSSRYEVIREDVTWTQANDKAHAKGGHLVTIGDANEEGQMEKLAAGAGIKYVWIGGYTSVRDNTAFGHWTTGEQFNYTNWYPGEPSRNDKDGTAEFYLMLWNVNGKWSWNDQRDDVCNSGLDYFRGNVGYIIEYEQ